MKCLKFESFDKTIIQCYLWDDVKAPKGIVQIVHGMAEHARRYDDFAKFLNSNGFIVWADDHRAHGETETKESIGYHDGNIYLDSVKDEIAMTRYLKDKYNLPVVLVGHSYGSFMSQRYIELCNEVCGVILSGSACMKGIMIDFGGFLAKVQAAFVKSSKPAKLMDKLSFGGYNKSFKDENSSFSWLSRDKEQVAKYEADEQCGYVMSIAFFKYFLNGLRRAYFKRNLKQIDKDLPIALFSGDHDPVGGNGKLVAKLYDQYKKLGIKNVSMKLYPDARHEILNETNNKEVYVDFLATIEEFFDNHKKVEAEKAEQAKLALEAEKAAAKAAAEAEKAQAQETAEKAKDENKD